VGDQAAEVDKSSTGNRRVGLIDWYEILVVKA